MLALRITATIEGRRVIDRVFEGLEARMLDWGPAQPDVIAQFRRMAAAAFSTEGASTGAPWKALAPSTQRARVREHFGAAHPILERWGTLKRSLTTDQGLGFVIRAPQSLSIGSNDPKFVYHQSNKPRKKIPRRAPILFTEPDRQALVHPIRVYVSGHSAEAPIR